jgi:methylase of polypeptide subunit release factors
MPRVAWQMTPVPPSLLPLPVADAALLALLRTLKRCGYRFITPTPATQARVMARDPMREARDLRDALGWSLPFARQALPVEIVELLDVARALEPAGAERWKSRYRVSLLGGELFLHSAYPTLAEDSVFFGPDSYRFADLVRRELVRRPASPGAHLVDIGAGAGVGAIVAAKLCPALRVTMTDVNAAALHLAKINAAAAGVSAEFVETVNLDGLTEAVDVALANPPYIIDPAGREYRDGGAMHGGRVASEMAAATLERLAPNGRLILYTGSAIIAGEDSLQHRLSALARANGCTIRYREIDPDVFGEELEKSLYCDVDRIALIAAVITRAS